MPHHRQQNGRAVGRADVAGSGTSGGADPQLVWRHLSKWGTCAGRLVLRPPNKPPILFFSTFGHHGVNRNGKGGSQTRQGSITKTKTKKLPNLGKIVKKETE